MQRVLLEGELGNRFGREWNTSCDKLIDIFKLIECQRDGFRPYMIECQENGIMFEIKRGNEYIQDESELLLSVSDDDITVFPVPAGSKGNVGKLIMAALIIYGGYVLMSSVAGAGAGGTVAATPGSVTAPTLDAMTRGQAIARMAGGYTMMAIGTSMGLRTINEMLLPDPAQTEDDSYLFNGPVNNAEQGAAIPILYGEMIVGGVTINSSYTTIPGVGTGSAYVDTEEGNSDLESVNFILY